MNLIENIISDMKPNLVAKSPYNIEQQPKEKNSHFEYKLAYLKMESEIPLFKAKLLMLEEETRILLENTELTLEAKEKQMDKIIKKTKKLFLEVISFIFASPLKEKEFVVNNTDGIVTLHGNLGYLFKYFLSQYSVDIEKTSKNLPEKNKENLFYNKDMTEKSFIETFNRNYYMPNNEDSLI